MAKGIDGGDYVVNNVHYCIQGCNLKMAKNCLDERVHFRLKKIKSAGISKTAS